MFKKEREKGSAFALSVLRDCDYATIATINTDGTPYCIPVSIALLDGYIYFHCATQGQKLDNIKKNNIVCISGVRGLKHIPEKFSADYESAVATGKCEIITDEPEKIMAIKAICEKYAASNMSNFEAKITPEALAELCICKINIEQITGKANGFN